MSILENLFNTLRDFLPTGIILCVIVFVIIGVRHVIDKRSPGASQNVRRQVMTALLSFIGLLVVILIIPEEYLTETSTGQILSLIGILLSAAIALSSTTLIGNAMAGLMLRSIRSFRRGDFVRIGEHFGRVTERGLFHIEIQTEDRDLTTLPNLYMVSNPVKVILSSGTLISAEVSLGYDVLYQDIEDCLKKAAAEAGLSDPFVLIIELGDFSITYRVSGMLTEVQNLISVRSTLRRMMVDYLHLSGIEIVSPNYMNTRALQEHKKIIPQGMKIQPGEEIKAEIGIERLAFDIAEEAASAEKVNELLEKTLKDIELFKHKRKESESDEEKKKIQIELERLESRLESIRKLIEKMNEPKQ
jgi:small-conductance mechanosensitive channel